jgi:hypothetical protein
MYVLHLCAALASSVELSEQRSKAVSSLASAGLEQQFAQLLSGDKYRRHGRHVEQKMNRPAETELAACKTLAGDTCSGPFFAHARVQGVGAGRRSSLHAIAAPKKTTYLHVS